MSNMNVKKPKTPSQVVSSSKPRKNETLAQRQERMASWAQSYAESKGVRLLKSFVLLRTTRTHVNSWLMSDLIPSSKTFSLQDMLDHLKDKVLEDPKDVALEYDSDEPSLEVIRYTLETDDVYRTRIRREVSKKVSTKKAVSEKELRERKEYKRLHALYGEKK